MLSDGLDAPEVVLICVQAAYVLAVVLVPLLLLVRVVVVCDDMALEGEGVARAVPAYVAGGHMDDDIRYDLSGDEAIEGKALEGDASERGVQILGGDGEGTLRSP